MDQHRGFKVPVPIKRYGAYRIEDKFGFFESSMPEGAVMHWKNKVDATLIKKYIDEDKIALWGRDDYYCLECGSILADVFLHIRHHKRIK